MKMGFKFFCWWEPSCKSLPLFLLTFGTILGLILFPSSSKANPPSLFFEENVSKLQKELKSENETLVMGVLRELKAIGAKAAPLTKDLVATFNKFRSKPKTAITFEVLRLLGTIGPEASDAKFFLEKLVSDELYARLAITALVKIGSGTKILPNKRVSALSPVFSFDFVKTKMGNNCTIIEPQKIEYLTDVIGPSCNFPGKDGLKFIFQEPLNLGERFSIGFWVKVKGLKLADSAKLFFSDVLDVNLICQGGFEKTTENVFVEKSRHNIITFCIKGNDSFSVASGYLGNSISFSEDAWYQLIFVRDGGRHLVEFFFNGERVFSGDDFFVWKGWNDEPGGVRAVFPRVTIEKIELGGQCQEKELNTPSEAILGFRNLSIFDTSLTEEEVAMEFKKGY